MMPKPVGQRSRLKINCAPAGATVAEPGAAPRSNDQEPLLDLEERALGLVLLRSGAQDLNPGPMGYEPRGCCVGHLSCGGSTPRAAAPGRRKRRSSATRG